MTSLKVNWADHLRVLNRLTGASQWTLVNPHGDRTLVTLVIGSWILSGRELSAIYDDDADLYYHLEDCEMV